jgi:hypothetical protein
MQDRPEREAEGKARFAAHDRGSNERMFLMSEKVVKAE